MTYFSKEVSNVPFTITHRNLSMLFLQLILQHATQSPPKGFRKVRDYGFLHSNVKKMLVQLILQVVIEVIQQRPRPVFKCSCCQLSQ